MSCPALHNSPGQTAPQSQAAGPGTGQLAWSHPGEVETEGRESLPGGCGLKVALFYGARKAGEWSLGTRLSTINSELMYCSRS